MEKALEPVEATTVWVNPLLASQIWARCWFTVSAHPIVPSIVKIAILGMKFFE